jgi:hypothetical protein
MRSFLMQPKGAFMTRSIRALALAVACLVPAASFAQGLGGGSATPLALDLKKVPVGSWAEYQMSIGGAASGMSMKSRWALVAKDAGSNTMEMSAEGKALERVGGKMVVKTVLVPDPVSSPKPVKQMVMKMGENDPMEMPLDMPGMPPQRFEKPDPKKLVGKEQVKVPAGTFKTSHYRDNNQSGTIDAWVSEEAPPLGMVKVVTTPKPGATGPGGQPVPPLTMELTARGKGAKSTITKPAKPFDPAMFGGGGGAPPPPTPPPAPKK